MASLWEISIKSSLGKLRFQPATNPALPDQLRRYGFDLLPIEWPSIQQAATLPWFHRDPFDRLIIAEALIHHPPILSTDSGLDGYGIERIGD